jgi:UDP-2,3-diacylglucosamine hydrolase
MREDGLSGMSREARCLPQASAAARGISWDQIFRLKSHNAPALRKAAALEVGGTEPQGAGEPSQALAGREKKLLPRLYRLFRGGDDHLLSGLGRLFEENGFRMLGAHEVAPEILMPEGSLGRCHPSERDRADIARGFALIEAIGSFDVGQAAVVADNRVLAIEAAENTDPMLARIAERRRAGRLSAPIGAGVLVKAPKPAQDRRFDMPSVGPATIEAVKRAGLAGIGVRAYEVIVAEPEALVEAADGAGLFITGVVSGPVR